MVGRDWTEGAGPTVKRSGPHIPRHPCSHATEEREQDTFCVAKEEALAGGEYLVQCEMHESMFEMTEVNGEEFFDEDEAAYTLIDVKQ